MLATRRTQMMLLTRHIRLGFGWAVLWSVLLVAVAGTAAAAEVVEIRVGRHPTFTRIVFETDIPAGYRIERQSDASGDATSITVTMEASSKPLSVSSGSSLVESVTVGEDPEGAVADIRLKQPGLRFKAMILANPPRIVVDVMGPTEPTATSRARAPGAKPIAVVAAESKQPAPKATAKLAKKKPTPSVKPGLSITAKTELDPGQSIAKATPAATPEKQREVEVGTESAAVALVTADEPPSTAKPSTPGKAARKVSSRPKRKPVSVASTRQKEESLLDALPVDGGTLARIAGALAVGYLAFAFVRRKKKAAPDEGTENDLFPALRDEASPDVGESAALGENLSDPAAAGATPAETGESAAGGFDFGGQAQPAAVDPTGPTGGSTPLAAPGGGLFDDEKKENPMEQLNTPVSGMDPVAPVGGMSGDAASELERRLAQVEARFEETVESCERLERQVAAQSEELRVQRAAIARTQRALRSLSRSEEEQATEPALREPLR